MDNASLVCNKETKYYMSIDTFNDLVHLEPLLSEQVGRMRFYLDNGMFIIQKRNFNVQY